MSQATIARAAEILWRARRERKLLSGLPADCRPQSLVEGYAVQDAMAALSGQAVAGWKIAATSEAGQRHIGVSEPLAGRLFADFVLADGARIEAAPLLMRVIEAEFAFRMGRDLPPRGRPYEVAEAVEAAAGLNLAIEVPDARFERFAEVGPAQIAADDAFAAWFVLGPALQDWRGLDLPRQQVRVTRNGSLAGEGRGANVLGDPRVALAWIANERAARGEGLKAGEIITTGTCVTPVPIGPGDRMEAEFLGLGSVRVAFA